MKSAKCKSLSKTKDKRENNSPNNLSKRKIKSSNCQKTKAKPQAMYHIFLIKQKVNEGLYNTLEAANKIRAEAEADKRQLAEDNIVLNEKITHRDSKVMEDRELVKLNGKKVNALDQKRTDLTRK